MSAQQIVTTGRRSPLLADDMGTGKTPQAIITYLLMLEQGMVHRLLVVCPKNVLYNWAHEFNKIIKQEVPLEGMVYQGLARKKMNIAKADIVIITYETLRNDIKRFEALSWGMIIFDEIHQIRNHDTGKSRAAMRLKANFLMGLSGTPIVNSLGDMHTIMQRLNPSLLGPRTKFDAEFSNGSSGWNGQRKYLDENWVYQKLKDKISAVMIRRDPEVITKDLPEFHKIVRWVSLKDTVQGRNYDELLQKGRLEFMDKKSGEVKAIEVRGHILALLTRLKQQVNQDFATNESAKCDALEEMLEDEILCDEDSRIVIFSQYLQTLNLLENRLKKWSPLRIDGSVSAQLRQEYALRFNDPSSPNRILIAQITACGEGINLEGGNFAILFDLWWNDAKHMQAFKRIRRMTQKRQQHFVYLITENTVEDTILQIIEKKSRAFSGVIEGQADASQFTSDELEEALFSSGFTNK